MTTPATHLTTAALRVLRRHPRAQMRFLAHVAANRRSAALEELECVLRREYGTLPVEPVRRRELRAVLAALERYEGREG